MFYFGFCAACVPHRFCCHEFDMRNIELPASTHLRPDVELSDAREMSGAPQTLMPKSLLEEFRFPLLEDLAFRSKCLCTLQKFKAVAL